MGTPSKRSLDLLRKQGYIVQVVEKWNAFSRTRIDLFGFIDIVAIKEGVKGVLGVQSTSYANRGARIKKIISIPASKIWLSTGNKILVHAWKKKKVGNRELWDPCEKEVTEEDF